MANEIKTYKIRKAAFGQSRPGDRFYYSALCADHKASVESTHGIVIEVGATDKPCAFCSFNSKFAVKVKK